MPVSAGAIRRAVAHPPSGNPVGVIVWGSANAVTGIEVYAPVPRRTSLILIGCLAESGCFYRSPNTKSELLALTATYCLPSTAYVIGPF